MKSLSTTSEINATQDLPPCKWYISIDEPECGKPAPFKLKVRGKITVAIVDVCDDHKAEHDRLFAKLRTAGRAI